MKFFAIDVQLTETREFLEATDEQIAEWLRLHSLCAKQVNGGRIEDADSLPEKFWQRHGINPATLFDPSPLWKFDSGHLVLEHFDHKGQRIFIQKSKGGKTRAEAMWRNRDSRTPINSPTKSPHRRAHSPIPSHPVPSQPDRIESLGLESTDPPSKKQQEEIAEAIYQAYPRKEKKPPALAAIKKAMAKHDPDFLLDRTKTYAAAISPWQERKFIPLPATWFNAEQFNDDPANWQKSAGPPRPPCDIGGRRAKTYIPVINSHDSPTTTEEDETIKF